MFIFQGYSAETSGGLLMSISAEGAKAFADEILAIEGEPAWVIGTVEVHFSFCPEYFLLFLFRPAVERPELWTVRP